MHEALSLRKLHVGRFLKHIRDINSLQLKSRNDFGKECHTKGSEPYFYDTAYKHGFQSSRLVIDTKERSIFAQTVLPSENNFVCDSPIVIDEYG